MQRIHSVADLRRTLTGKNSVALVPTMGNLHNGHLHLAQLAKQRGHFVVVSIFVNPLQFGANEDLASYPRTVEADCEKLQASGVDIAFVPSVQEMYPSEQTMTIVPPPIADELCGATRPGHFAGVATVVMKLFNMVHPAIAVFGKKDFQQLFIIREMVRQFNLPIEILAGETVRESSGLAMSSRNGYLNDAQLVEAPRLYKTLIQVAQAVGNGEDIAKTESHATQYLTQLGWIVDYVSVRSAQTLMPPNSNDKELVALAAARLGKTRLIDNIEFALI